LPCSRRPKDLKFAMGELAPLDGQASGPFTLTHRRSFTPGRRGVKQKGFTACLSVWVSLKKRRLPLARWERIDILGTDLTGATSVTFNGTAAKFTVVSSSEINTAVPSGATTGEVKVVTPGDTLSNNAPFEVVP
jgi:hypothetical protein